jgi:hypothetical protein
MAMLKNSAQLPNGSARNLTMIKSANEYRVTSKWIATFDAQLAAVLAAPETEWSDLEAAALESMLETLRREIVDYEEGKSDDPHGVA